MQKIGNISDPHFNLFFVYSGGDTRDLDHARQLEDNMTRSFLITLSKLEDSKQIDFIRELLSDPKPGRSKINLGGGKIKYDLQNLKSGKEIVYKTEEKILLLISGISARGDGIDKSAFDINKFSALKEKFEELEKLQKMGAKNESKDLIRNIKEAYRANQKSGQKTPFECLPEAAKGAAPIEVDYDQLCSLYKGLHNSRPDGWIYSKRLAILIEAKVGTNAQDKWQLFRHLTNENGFNINSNKVFGGKKCKDYRLVNKTWGEVSDLFGQIDLNNMLVKEFKEYLIMCGEILDLSFIVKEEEYNADKMSAQFPLLLSKLDRAISGLKIKEIDGLTRARRPLDELWDYYGFEKPPKGTIGFDPDYMVDFNEESACFALRTNSPKQIKTLLKTDPESKNDNEFRRVLLDVLNAEEKLNERYFISLKTDRIVDWRKGVRKGKKFDTFFFSITLSELQKKVTKRKPIEKIVDELFNTMLNLTPFAKRLSFGFKILYPDVKKINDSSILKKKNKEVFDQPERFIKFCTDFISDTKGIISMIK